MFEQDYKITLHDYCDGVCTRGVATKAGAPREQGTFRPDLFPFENGDGFVFDQELRFRPGRRSSSFRQRPSFGFRNKPRYDQTQYIDQSEGHGGARNTTKFLDQSCCQDRK